MVHRARFSAGPCGGGRSRAHHYDQTAGEPAFLPVTLGMSASRVFAQVGAGLVDDSGQLGGAQEQASQNVVDNVFGARRCSLRREFDSRDELGGVRESALEYDDEQTGPDEPLGDRRFLSKRCRFAWDLHSLKSSSICQRKRYRLPTSAPVNYDRLRFVCR